MLVDGDGKAKSRFMGLIVVPGKYVEKIEVA